MLLDKCLDFSSEPTFLCLASEMLMQEIQRWLVVAGRVDIETPRYRTSVFLACVGDEAFDIFDGFSFWGRRRST